MTVWTPSLQSLPLPLSLQSSEHGTEVFNLRLILFIFRAKFATKTPYNSDKRLISTTERHYGTLSSFFYYVNFC